MNLEVVKRFASFDIDDFVSADDISAHITALKEYEAGETVSHNEINWN